jgi:N-acetylneuraminic acid mutarotase
LIEIIQKPMKIIFVLFFFSLSVYSQHIPTALSEAYDGEIQLVFSQNSGRVAGEWTQVTGMPYPRYYGASVSYSRNDTTWLYIFGGDTTGSGDATKGCIRYNVNTDSWEYIDTLPVPMRVSSAARLGDKLYTMGGFDSRQPSHALKKFYVYDVNENTWNELPDLPDGIFFHKSFGYQDSLIYIVGGIRFDSTLYLNKVLLFNTNTQSFSEAAPLPEQRASFALVILDNSFYITGGLFNNDSLSNKTITASIDSLNHSQISYSISMDSLSNYPIQVHAHSGYPDGNDKINFFGGSITRTFSPVRSSFVYKIAENSYDTVSSFPYSTTAFQSGYSYTSDSILTVVVSGGVVSGSAFTSETWVYRDTLTTTGLNDPEDNIPADFVLYQNYPNPFNPSSTIEYQIPSSGFVTLTIYNSIGQEVSTLVNEYQSSGKYSAIFSADELPSGLYFYTLRSGGFSFTKKMLLIK